MNRYTFGSHMLQQNHPTACENTHKSGSGCLRTMNHNHAADAFGEEKGRAEMEFKMVDEGIFGRRSKRRSLKSLLFRCTAKAVAPNPEETHHTIDSIHFDLIGKQLHATAWSPNPSIG
ncbi:hypothetical protein MUK42_34052 [Musa troglodytarum]|uniref:Uncharacterized protein n=1 Tax=Musa troglodytarum TaxID=320322 RepID=A0A9E7GD17_9LILI|nr:hypothetical protein MUK42_34052 [Musa troglodytarum]